MCIRSLTGQDETAGPLYVLVSHVLGEPYEVYLTYVGEIQMSEFVSACRQDK